MKSRVIILFFLVSFQSFGQLKAYLDTKQFYDPQIGNYVEIYMQFVSSSIKYESKTDGLQGKVAIRLNVSQRDSSFFSDVYILESPVMKDSIVEDFYDVVRFAIKPGKYDFKIELSDVVNEKSKAIKAESELVVKDLSKNISISDLEIAEFARKSNENSNFTKSGLYILPRLTNYYPSELSKIPVYFEVYNSNQLSDSIFIIKQLVRNTETSEELFDFEYFSKHTKAAVVPIVRGVEIANLPTGKYELIFSIIDRSKKEYFSQSYTFERTNILDQNLNLDNLVLDPAFQNSITDDSLDFYLESLIPIAKQSEILNIISSLKTKNKEVARKHIQGFWVKTSPTKPYDAWISYKQQVQFVQKLYSNNFQDGYETDRGRVYLRYGAPTNVIQKETSPSEYPYEIWQYNKIERFSNKRFIFYNPDLVNNTYRLLHSDMLGEVKNQGWQAALSKRNTVNGSVDNPNMYNQDHFGGNSNDLFRQY
ncbi:MAG: GWxTD domain-containing protein [Bacteroidota bacterium]